MIGPTYIQHSIWELIIPPLILNFPSSLNSRCLKKSGKGMMEQRGGQQKFSPNSQHPNINKERKKEKVVSMDASNSKFLQ